MNVRFLWDNLRLCGNWRRMIREHLCGFQTRDRDKDLERHLSQCPRCQAYSQQIENSIRRLSHLPDQEISTGAAFQARWRRAVLSTSTEEQAHTGTNARPTYAWLAGEARPALALASIWILILALKATSPDPAPAATGTSTWSPSQIFAFLLAEKQLVGGSWRPETLKAQFSSPGSQRP